MILIFLQRFIQLNKFNLIISNHFEEKSFENQLSSQNVFLLELTYNVLKVLQFYMKFKAFIKALTFGYCEILNI
jgi:hypothetical protein